MHELIPTAARKFGTNFRSVLLSGQLGEGQLLPPPDISRIFEFLSSPIHVNFSPNLEFVIEYVAEGFWLCYKIFREEA